MEATNPTTPPPPRGKPFRVGDGVLAAHVSAWFDAWKPRQRLGLPEWSAEHARLEDGRKYRAFPFQRDIAAALTQPGVRQVTVMKSARVGYSKIIQNFIAYSIAQRPRKVLIYQPTIDDAEKYSRDDIEPVLRWRAVEEKAVFKPRHRDNQTRAKRFPGGWLQIKGMNSAKEFRRVSADVVIIEEPDGAPPTAGISGDQTKLAFMRCFTSDDPLKIAGGTPLLAGHSRTEDNFLEGTQEHRYVPCPHCGHRQVLVFGDGTGPGIRWEPQDKPTRAWYRCAGERACDIEEDWKAWMDERGEFVPHAPDNDPSHRSFHIWAAYSQFPEAAWLNIAREFLASRKDAKKLQPFVNEWLGQTWKLKGEAPEWERLLERAAGESFAENELPRRALILTAGADCQKDRVEVYVWAWAPGFERWMVAKEVFLGSPATWEPWKGVKALLVRTYRAADGGPDAVIARLAVDTGGQDTVKVYAHLRRIAQPLRLMPVKGGKDTGRPVGVPSYVDAKEGERKLRRALRLWHVNSGHFKDELYSSLRQVRTDDGFPPGWVHLPPWIDAETCRQLVAEQLVATKTRTGYQRLAWEQTRDRNEALDCEVYARAALFDLGADRLGDAFWAELAAAREAEMVKARPEPEDVPEEVGVPPAPAPAPSLYETRRPSAGSWMRRGR